MICGKKIENSENNLRQSKRRRADLLLLIRLRSRSAKALLALDASML